MTATYVCQHCGFLLVQDITPARPGMRTFVWKDTDQPIGVDTIDGRRELGCVPLGGTVIARQVR